ncbi:MAG: alpha-ketoglutarate-dependent dioxygenase AlkB [Flavisolibacter sp.]|nr:alpha-ketoglutarate-dependent dioxygenase AlkB [Flavisolibacter sp.]
MLTLFPVEPVVPEGFLYVPDFIDPMEETELYNEVIKTKFQTFTFQGYEARRKVASFGYDWSFEHQKLSKGAAIPDAFLPLIEKVAKQLSFKRDDFSELLLTEYPIGSVINWHRDAPPFDLIAGISLLSDCIFRLRPYDKAKQNRTSIITIPVKRRSLYILQGPARTDWQHSITAVKEVRYSITLRTLKNKV